MRPLRGAHSREARSIDFADQGPPHAMTRV
jgi:hypothetical protein